MGLKDRLKHRPSELSGGQQQRVAVGRALSASQSKAALDTVLAQWPNGELQDQAAFKESITSQIDMILNLIYGLLLWPS